MVDSYEVEVAKQVQQYLDHKFAPTPLTPATNSDTGTNGKAPTHQNWATVRVRDVLEWRGGKGIGLVCGPIGYTVPKTILLCIDLDSVEAVRFGGYFLPDTGMIGGRKKKPESNRFYIVPETKAVSSTEKFISKRGDTHVEILGQNHQAVVAPTVVIGKDGVRESKVWYQYDAGPARVDWDELRVAVVRLAVFCELYRIWPKGGRHNLSLPLAGGLLRSGWPEEMVIWAIHTLGAESGWASEPGEIENAVRNTATKLDSGDSRVTGWPTIVKSLGESASSSIERILKWLGTDTDERPGIELKVGQLDKTVQKAWKILADANDPVSMLRFSNEPVRIERIDDREAYLIIPLTTDRLRYHCSQHMSWYRKGSDDARKPLDPPRDVIQSMLAAGDVPLPILNRIVTAPVFAPDGRLQTEPGYHASSKTFYIPGRGMTLRDVSEKPDGGDIEKAKGVLFSDLLVDFPFAKKSDLAHTLALILLPFARDLISGPTPMHIIDANTQASGKTLLAAVATMIFTGETGAMPLSFPTSEEEMGKTLLSVLSEGRTHIYFDNVVGRMSSAALAMAITANTYVGRRLGATETLSPPVRCIWLATANQATGDTDVIRRSVHIRLVSKVENPHLIPIDRWRHFPLKDWAVDNRGELIWSVLTLIQKWVAEGMKRRACSFGDFGDWAGVIGGILDSAGIAGFLDDVTDFQLAANEDREAWQDIYEGIWERFGIRSWTAAETIMIALSSGIEVRGRDLDDQKREWGNLLRGKIEVIHGGLRLEGIGKAARRGSGKGYQLLPVDGRDEHNGEVKNTKPIQMGNVGVGDGDGIIRIRELM